MDNDEHPNFQPDDDDYVFRDQLVAVLNQVMSDLDVIGVKADADMNAMPKAMFDESEDPMDPDDTLRSGHKAGRVAVFASFQAELVPRICFSERILNPEADEVNKQFRAQLPTEEEVELKASIEDLKKMLDNNDDN